jgi:hypothetical protein
MFTLHSKNFFTDLPNQRVDSGEVREARVGDPAPAHVQRVDAGEVR